MGRTISGLPINTRGRLASTFHTAPSYCGERTHDRLPVPARPSSLSSKPVTVSVASSTYGGK